MFKKLLIFIIFATFALAFPGSAFAFGITPAEVFIENIKPATHYEKEIFLTRPAAEVKEELKVVLEPDLGDMDSWFTFVPGKEFDFPTGKNTTTFKVIIDVPAGTELKNFVGQITAKGISSKKASEGVTIIKGAILGVKISTSDKDNLSLQVLNMTAPDVESGDPVSVLLNIKNTGNASSAPDSVNLEIMDLFEKPRESLSDTTLEKIDSFSTKEITAEFNSNLPKGQYRVDASVIFQGEEIARKKMVLTVNAKPAAVVEESEEAETVAETGRKNARAASLFVSGILLLAYMLSVLLRKDDDSAYKLERPVYKLFHKEKALARIFLGVGMLMVAMGVYYYLLDNGGKNATDNSNVVETPGISPTVSIGKNSNEEQVSGSTTDVKGVSVEAEATISPIRVERPGTQGLYQIYSDPTFGSEIVYEARDGETFNVIGKNEDWYNVTLDDGTTGWLHNTEIKSSN